MCSRFWGYGSEQNRAYILQVMTNCCGFYSPGTVINVSALFLLTLIRFHIQSKFDFHQLSSNCPSQHFLPNPESNLELYINISVRCHVFLVSFNLDQCFNLSLTDIFITYHVYIHTDTHRNELQFFLFYCRQVVVLLASEQQVMLEHHFITLNTQTRGIHYYYPSFTCKETEAQKSLNKLPKVILPVEGYMLFTLLITFVCVQRVLRVTDWISGHSIEQTGEMAQHHHLHHPYLTND